MSSETSSITHETTSENPTGTVVGVSAERVSGERRVALVPVGVAALKRQGLSVLVEAGAGRAAGFTDDEYRERGAEIVTDRTQLFEQAEVILQIWAGGPAPELTREFRSGQTVIAQSDPLSHPEAVQQLAEQNVTAFSLELVPRITRAQSMDVLSSMATIAGYKAVLLAATEAPRLFPMLMTAAGTVKAARVFVMGAGVAGLQAIATARRLGAVVQAYDIRPAVAEQVESLGAKFVVLDLETASAEGGGGYAKEMDEDFLRRQREQMGKVIADCDVVITTAAIPGKPAPILVTEEMVRGMAPGSVIVDLAAERGGNCELTRPGETIDEDGVTILGPMNLPATVPRHASEMFSRNITTFLGHLIDDGQLSINALDEIEAATLLTENGEVVQPRVRELLGLAPLVPATTESVEETIPLYEGESTETITPEDPIPLGDPSTSPSPEDPARQEASDEPGPSPSAEDPFLAGEPVSDGPFGEPVTDAKAERESGEVPPEPSAAEEQSEDGHERAPGTDPLPLSEVDDQTREAAIPIEPPDESPEPPNRTDTESSS